MGTRHSQAHADTAAEGDDFMDSGEPQPQESGLGQSVRRPEVVRADGETGGQRFARGAHRTLLYAYVIAAVVVLVILIALVVANTGAVTVSWVFGSAQVSLVWLVLGSAILGLFLGMLTGALLSYRTRRPH
jgi:uncharacterized integral membrane protein